MKHYDVIVIGGGSGLKIANYAANQGFKVALIEKEKMGGTCLNRGCIPSKMLIHTAEMLSQLHDLEKFNISLSEKAEADFEKLFERVSHLIDEESIKIEKGSKENHNIDVYKSNIKFIADGVLKIGHLEISGDRFFLCCGAHPEIPHIKGLNSVPYMTYREALRPEKKPRKLIILGGGYIAAELGFLYSSLGVETHFFVRSQMLSKEDFDIQEAFESYFCSKHNVHLKCVPLEFHYENGVITMIYSDEEEEVHEFQADALLVAVGVRSSTEGLGLDKTKIKFDEKGNIIVDRFLKTTAPNIWAWGDCIGRKRFRHVANFEAEYLIESVFESKAALPIEYPPIPHAIFTDPQIGSVGKTENELKREGKEYVVGFHEYKNSGKGLAIQPTIGFVKLLVDKATRKLLGAHIIGQEASDLIHSLIAFMTMQATIDDVLKMIFIHPTLSEVIKSAAIDAYNQL